MKKRMFQIIFNRTSALLLLGLLTLCVNTGFLGFSKEKLDENQFILAVEDFFRLSGQNSDLALATFASDDGLEKLDAAEKKLFPVSGGNQGWHYFLSSSVYITAPVAGDACLVMFYNPFCDAALLTLWQLNKETLGIADADVFMGDFIRQAGKTPFDTDPRWLRKKDEAPLTGVVCSVNETLAGFQNIYGKSNTKEQKKWRKKLKNIKDATAMELNHALSGAFFENTFIGLESLFADAAFDAVEKELRKTLDALMAGKAAAIIKKAAETDPETARFLTALPPADWQRMTATAFLDFPTRSLVFFTPANNGNQLGCFVFEKQKKTVRLQRIDYVDLKQTYANYRRQIEK